MDEDNIRSIISDINDKAESVLNIGCSLFRTSIVMPHLAQRFHELYPNVHLQFHSYHSDELMNLMLDGKLDFSISIDRFKNPLIESDILFQDSLYLMVSKKLLLQYYGESYADLLPKKGESADLSTFADLPFLNILSVKLIDDIFQHSGITPKYHFTVTHPPFSRASLYEDNVANIVTKTIYLHLASSLPDEIMFIPLVTPPTMELHPISFIRNSKKYFSKFSRAFYALAKSYFQELSQ